FTTLKNGIGSALSGLGGVVAAPLNAGISAVEGFVNGIANAINWVSRKLGGGNIIGTFSIPKVGGGGGGGGSGTITLPGFEGFAKGTPFAPGGWGLVGERGPELMF